MSKNGLKAAWALVGMVGFGMVISAAGCARVGQLKAMKAFKEANQAYQQQDYKKTADPYQTTVQRMIQLDPSDPTNYFALANIYEQAGAYPEAEQMLLRAKDAKPADPSVYMQLAGYYNRQGEFDKTISALEQRAQAEPNNPE